MNFGVPQRLVAVLVPCLLAAAIASLAGCATVPPPRPALEVFAPLPEDGGIWGAVTDHAGSAIPGAEVTLEDKRNGLTRRAGADSAGRYAFHGLEPDRYEVHAVAEGFKASGQAVEYRGGSRREDFALEIGMVVEVEYVSGKAASIRSVPLGASPWRATLPPPTPDFNTEEYGATEEPGFAAVVNRPLSTFSIDVDTASYANVRRFLHDGRLPPADAVRIEELLNYFDYDYPEPAEGEPFSVVIEMAGCPWKPTHRLVHIGLRSNPVATASLPPSNLVFLIDVSGSMRDSDKLPLLKKAFSLLARQLRPQDQVSIVVYAGAAGMVLPPTSGAQKTTILSTLSRLEAGGSTAGGAGIQLAYKLARENFIEHGNNRVILATDGDFNVGVSSDGELVQMIEHEREAGVFLTILGFGTGNLKDLKLEQLADHGNGNYAYIDNLLEARRVLVEQMGATLLTVAKDVKLQLEFNPVQIKAYRLIGYENRRLRDEEFTDDRRDAGDLGAGHSVTALYEVIPAGSDESLPGVDPLKYQQTSVRPDAAGNNEVLTVKLRYRPPEGSKSRLLTRVLPKHSDSAEPTQVFRFAAGVAEFGLLLRDSPYKGGADYGRAFEQVRQALGSDEDGRRSEFLSLIRTAEKLTAAFEVSQARTE